MKHQAFLANYNEVKNGLVFKQDQIIMMIDNEKRRWKDHMEKGPKKREQHLRKTMNAVSKFEIDLHTYCNSSLLQVHQGNFAKLDKEGRERFFDEQAHLMFDTRIESPLFAPYYLPSWMEGLQGMARVDKFNKVIGSESGIGFYYPTAEDII